MSTIFIQHLDDTHECDDCGFSYAEGGRVVVDGEVIYEFIPFAHCYGSDDIGDVDTLWLKLLNHLGHDVIIVEGGELE